MTIAVMNPDGLSAQAEKRLADRARGQGLDDPEPDYDDHGAVAAWRAAQHEAWGEGTVDGEIEHRPVTIAGLPCLAAGPGPNGDIDPEPLPTVLHLHAGGYCLGSPGTDAPITARLARRFRVVSVDYRLAPEHPYPAALDDCERVYRALAVDGPVAITGISAGGGLAIGVARRAADTQPVALALLCPHLDFGASTGRAMVGYERAYLADHPRDDDLVSPSDASPENLAALPPMLVQTTTPEHLYNPIERFRRLAVSAGADVTGQVWHGLWHAWHYHRELPEAWHAVDAAADWLAARSG